MKSSQSMSDKQVFLTRRSPTYWRVKINHPPLNIFGPDTIPQLKEAITAVETDEPPNRQLIFVAKPRVVVIISGHETRARHFARRRRAVPDDALDRHIASRAGRGG
jgi:enoyl-CoA hydratase/carnithine racemase